MKVSCEKKLPVYICVGAESTAALVENGDTVSNVLERKNNRSFISIQ